MITDKAPVDRYNLVWWIFVAMGVATLLPWNITINQCAPYYVNHKITNSYRHLLEEIFIDLSNTTTHSPDSPDTPDTPTTETATQPPEIWYTLYPEHIRVLGIPISEVPKNDEISHNNPSHMPFKSLYPEMRMVLIRGRYFWYNSTWEAEPSGESILIENQSPSSKSISIENQSAEASGKSIQSLRTTRRHYRRTTEITEGRMREKLFKNVPSGQKMAPVWDPKQNATVWFCCVPEDLHIFADDGYTRTEIRKRRSIDTNDSSNATSAANSMPQWEEYFCDAAVLSNQIPVLIIATVYMLMGSTSNEKVVMKNLISIAVMVLIQMTNTGLALADTSSWTNTFLIMSLCLISAAAIAANIFSAGSWVNQSVLPPSHARAILTGQGISGILVSLISIIITSISIAGGSYNAGIVTGIIFGTVALMLAGVMIAYKIVLDKSFFVFHAKKMAGFSLVVTNPENGETTPAITTTPIPSSTLAQRMNEILKEILAPNWLEGLNIFICFAATLAVFPGITMWVLPKALEESMWNWTLWSQLWTFLNFNLANVLGIWTIHLLATRIPRTKPTRTLLVNLARAFVGILIILVSNVHIAGTAHYAMPKEHALPDWIFIITLFIFSYGHGAISAISISSFMLRLKPKNLRTGALVSQLILAVAITAGLAITPLLKMIYA